MTREYKSRQNHLKMELRRLVKLGHRTS